MAMEANEQQKILKQSAPDMNVSFVILHYLAYEETKNCVESILQLRSDSSSVNIVIVDNNSANGSYEELKSNIIYPNIHYIHNNKNLGFAAGMNVGYRYARNEIKSNVIILMNNDLVIKQSDFIEMLGKVVESGYDVIGPDIIAGKDRKHVNPQTPESNYAIAYLRYGFIRTYYTVISSAIGLKLYDTLKKKIKTNTSTRNIKSAALSSSEHEDVQLHGACLIFANKFVQMQEECLDGRTFLYHEEDLLFQLCMRKHYRISYTPKLKVYHEGGVSTNSASGNERVKKIRNLKYHMDSVKYVIKDTVKYGRYYPKI